MKQGKQGKRHERKPVVSESRNPSYGRRGRRDS
jgi:hypothetical protein